MGHGLLIGEKYKQLQTSSSINTTYCVCSIMPSAASSTKLDLVKATLLVDLSFKVMDKTPLNCIRQIISAKLRVKRNEKLLKWHTSSRNLNWFSEAPVRLTNVWIEVYIILHFLNSHCPMSAKSSNVCRIAAVFQAPLSVYSQQGCWNPHVILYGGIRGGEIDNWKLMLPTGHHKSEFFECCSFLQPFVFRKPQWGKNKAKQKFNIENRCYDQ